mgnify:CR=1 FL=1
MAAIVFDLDGTLVDSAPDIAAAANRMLAEWGAAPLPLATITRFIGNGIPHLVRLARQERDIPASEEARMKERMLALYTAHPADLTRPYPGVVEALERLGLAGHVLGVCTNKFRAPSVQILEALDLARFFKVVIGGDSLRVKKPDPAPLAAAFNALSGDTALYVGDSEIDAEAARAADCPFALFTRGYRKAPVDTLPHDIAFDDHAMLPALVAARPGWPNRQARCRPRGNGSP